jgi:hypothetical protein
MSLLTTLGAIVAALFGLWGIKSVMIANHRQAWINALRDDLAQFFTSIDAIHFVIAKLSLGGDSDDLEEQQKARNAVLLANRRILMRLNMTEPLHQRLEKALEPLLCVRGKTVNEEELGTAVRLARQVLKHEWEVTKYGFFTTPVVALKTGWKRLRRGSE